MASNSDVRERSISPTRSCFEMRQEAQQRLGQMAMLGLHVFNPGWNKEGFAVRDGEVVKACHLHSGSFKECTLKIQGSSETITIPVQVCTKVWDVKCAVANQAMVSPDQLTFVTKQGCSWRIQLDTDEIGRTVTVRGIVAFAPQPHKWPHTTIMIGAGYNGIKNALLWMYENSTDFHIYEKYDRIGGHAWLVQANKTSKLQTEMGAFHVWFGMQWGDNPKLGYPVEWSTWPKKDEVIASLQHAADVYGIVPHITFRHEVKDLMVVGKLSDHDRTYNLQIQPLERGREAFQLTTSCCYHFPGAYFNPRKIEYPGQDDADLVIGYGMNDDMPYDYLDGNRVAILGNGAFAVENIRTCMEYGAEKVYLVTRKKNLPSPRLCCWFVHQSITPVPAKMLLNCFTAMYDQCGFGDPWGYHSVYASKNKEHCTINSHSRFGIGDVTFLAVAWGRCEYVVDLLKRCTYHTLHLVSGTKLENIRVIVKALGLIADWGADRFHKIKEMIGTWPAGDHRRILFCDPLGMHAANFSSFSTGVGSYVASLRDKHLIDFPQEYYRLQATGVLEMLPKTKADLEGDKPAHQYDAKYATSVSMVVDGNLPRVQAKMAGMDTYFHVMMWRINPFEKYYAECKQSWDQYQEDWWKMGFKHEYTPFPYTKEIVTTWFEKYRQTVGPTEPNPSMTYTPRANGRVLEEYVPSWEREGVAMESVEEAKGEDEEESATEAATTSEPPAQPVQQPNEQGAQEQQSEEQIQPAQKGPSDEEVRAYFKQMQAASGEVAVVDPVFGSVFQEVPWDQDGSRYWWETWGKNGRPY
mmetsp:Transcript_63406/g.147729  ORF Transcript_63406/g.147729 Transcript_63406/m.147729 type:complete len:806 (-) Transcript_63406:121-2538(-)